MAIVGSDKIEVAVNSAKLSAPLEGSHKVTNALHTVRAKFDSADIATIFTFGITVDEMNRLQVWQQMGPGNAVVKAVRLGILGYISSTGHRESETTN